MHDILRRLAGEDIQDWLPHDFAEDKFGKGWEVRVKSGQKFYRNKALFGDRIFRSKPEINRTLTGEDNH